MLAAANGRRKCYSSACSLRGPLPARCYRFDEFELDGARFELRRNGRSVKLERIPLELFILLAERNGDVVTRQEIVERLWGKDVFVDTEHGINTAIRKIRTALRDDAERSRYVQTVSGKGYRFVAPVIAEPQLPSNGVRPIDSAPLEIPSSAHAAPQRTVIAGRIAAGISVLIAIAAILVGMNFHGWRDRIAGHPAKPTIQSLAVLPLDNLSGDPAQDYFADGMTDELITMLAKNSGLRLISRTSVMQYKKAQRPIRDIARELGVDGILEGSVERSGNRIHLNAQLIYAPEDLHLWAESYDRDLSNVTSLQSELAKNIAQQVGVLSSSPPRPERPINAEAYEAYLKGRYFQNIRGPSLHKAVEYYQLAIQKEPTFALAYAGLAESQWRAEDSAGAKRSANKALELDGTMGEPFATLGQIKAYDELDFAGAEEDYKRAIALSPNYPPARQWYGQFLHWMGRLDEAMGQLQIGQQLDPLSLIMSTDRSEVLLHMNQLDAATMQIKKVLELNPGYETGHFVLGEIYEREKNYDAALAEYKESIRLSGQDHEAYLLAVEARLCAEGGRTKEATRLLDRSEKLCSKRPPSESCGEALALAYAALDDHDNAFLWLERLYADRSPDLVALKMDEGWGPLHGDSRFADLLKRVGFQP